MKTFKLFLISTFILTFQNFYCMDLSETQQKLTSTLEKHFNDQKYLELTNLLYDRLDKYGDMVAQNWIDKKSDSTASVHCLYFQVRQLNKIAQTPSVIFTPGKFKRAFKLMLFSLIRTKQDISCCLSLKLKDEDKATAQNTYQIFLSKYWHLWNEIIKAGLEKKFLFLTSIKH